MRDITLGETFYHFFTTRAFATGVPTVLSGTPVLSVLEENNATPITAGVSVSVDRASVVGLNQATIIATGGNGYAAGMSYAIYISTGTVGGVSVVGEVVGEFTIQASSAFTRLGAPAGASVSADILVIDNLVDDLESRLGTPSNLGSGATVAANLVDIEGQTDDIGVAGAGLTNIGTIATVTTLTNLPAITANWLTATGINADAFTAAKFADDVSTEFANKVWDTDATGRQTQGTFGQAIGDPVADTNTIFKAVVTDATGATVGIDVVAVKAETVTIQADTDNIQTRLPAALVSGRMDSDVAVIQANVITAGVIATDAIDSDAIAATGATEIANAVWDTDATGRQTQGTFGQAIGDPVADTNTIYKAVVTDATGATVGIDVVAVKAETVTILADTDNIQTRLPAALVSGRMDSDVAVIQANVITATSINADAITAAKVAADVTAEIADGVWDEAIAGHLGAGSTGEKLNAAGAAGDPWNTALPGAYGAGTAGKIVGDNVNAPIATVDTVVDAIKAKTDSLTFTVAGMADANIQAVNDVTVTGNGQPGTEWGP